MKRIFSIFMVALMAFSLVACGENTNETTAAATEKNTAAAETTAAAESTTEEENEIDPVVINIAHTSAGNDDDAFQYTCLRFKEKIEAKTNGAVTVEIFPNAVYGNEREQFEAVMLGTVNMAIMSAANIAEFDAAFNAISLPFVFASSEVSWEALDGEAGQAIGDSLESIGVKGFSWAETGFRHMITNGHGIKTVADFDGMKVRSVENAIYVGAYNAWGANPTPLAWSETLTAFQQGAVDGFDIPTSIIHGSALYDMGEYFSMTGQFINCQYVVGNLAWYDALDDSVKEAICECMEEACSEERTWLKANEESWLEEAEDNGMIVIRPEEIDFDTFKAPLQDMYDEYAEKSGGTYVYDLINAANAAAEKLLK